MFSVKQLIDLAHVTPAGCGAILGGLEAAATEGGFDFVAVVKWIIANPDVILKAANEVLGGIKTVAGVVADILALFGVGK